MSAVLFAYMKPSEQRDRAFSTWYEGDHVPGRLGVPGFLGAGVYRRASGGPSRATLYELDALNVLTAEPYLRLRTATDQETQKQLSDLRAFARLPATVLASAGDEEGSTGLFALWFAVPPDARDEFDRWYVEEHGPILLSYDGWLRWRLLEVDPAGSNTSASRLILHDLAHPDVARVLRSDLRWQTPWYERFANEPWFRAPSGGRFRAVPQPAGAGMRWRRQPVLDS